MQPTLSQAETAAALYKNYMQCESLEDDSSIEFHWGFDPLPEMGLPFCYRIEDNVGPEEVPIFENVIYSASYMLAHCNNWCSEHSFNFPWPSYEGLKELLLEHLVLRAALNLDRRNTIERYEALIAQTGAVLGVDDFVPREVLRSLSLPKDHPMFLAIAYDLWRLGDYGDAKDVLTSAFGFEPLAPPFELVSA